MELNIDLRDIFISIWKQKIIIICITLITTLLTGLYSVFLITPVYQSNLNIVISMPETYTTKYGVYTFPITTDNQYINLITSNDILLNTMKDMDYNNDVTLQDMKDSIVVGAFNTSLEVNQNVYEITISADNPSKAQQLAQTLFENFAEFLEVRVAENAIDYYYDFYTEKMEELQDNLEVAKLTLENNEKLLSTTPATINQNEAMDAIKNKSSYNNFIVLENIINPNYTNLEGKIIENKQTINQTETNIKLYSQYIDELNNMTSNVKEYYNSGNSDKLNSNMINMIKNNVYLMSNPVAPDRKTSPSNARNTLIGAFLGVMLGIIFALVKEYLFDRD